MKASHTPMLVLGDEHEPSAWLRAAVASALASLPPRPRGRGVLVGYLTDPAASLFESRERWERSCDRCGLWTPPGPPFWLLRLAPRPGVVLLGGLCEACMRREVQP